MTDGSVRGGATPAPAGSGSTGTHRRVLVVDDSPVIRQVVQIYLRDQGFDFEEAGDGHRALQLARLVRFDLVIADVRMPGLDGIRFITQLRAAHGATDKDVPVVLITGEKSTDTLRRGAEAGATICLKKPVSSAGLIDAIGKIFGAPAKAAATKVPTRSVPRP